MRKTFVTVLLNFLLMTSFGQLIQSKEFQNSIIGRDNLISVFSTGGLFWVGSTGIISRTDTNFEAEQVSRLDLCDEVQSIYFTTPDIGYFLTSKGELYSTTDKGDTWNFRFQADGDYYHKVWFYDNLIGYLCGEFLYKTSDGGETWQKLSTESTNFNDLFFISPEVGFTVSDSEMESVSDGENPDNPVFNWMIRIYKTEDGGLTWRLIDNRGIIYQNDLTRIIFVNGQIGWATGSQLIPIDSSTSRETASIMKTTDGGETWAQQPDGNDWPGISDVVAKGKDSLIVAAGTTLRISLDGGAHWKTKYFQQPVNRLFRNERSELFSIGYSGTVMKSPDFGNSWSEWNDGFKKNLTNSFFIDSLRGWIGSIDGVLLSTTDGGAIWSQSTIPETSVNRDLHFFNPDTGLVISYDGVIMKTENGGKSWVQKESGLTDNLREITFVNDFVGWVVSEGNYLLQTKDAGESWVLINSEEQIKRVSFITENLGYAIARNPIVARCLMKTTDGGRTWKCQYSGADFQQISFIDSLNGWATTSQDVFHTGDGGANWSRINDEKQFLGMNKLHFVNKIFGYTTNSKALLYTLDGGYTWSSECIQNEGNASALVGGKYIWVNGPSGAISKLTVDRNNFCIADTTYQNTTISAGSSIFAGGDWQSMPGTYTDNFQNSFGCDSVVVTRLSVVTNSAIWGGENAIRKIYPSPAEAVVWVDCEDCLVELYNVLGRMVLTSTKKRLDVNFLPPGLYLAKLVDKDGRIDVFKLIKR